MGRRRPEEKTIAARRRFLSEGALPGADIPLHILRSWKRSAELGLHMGAKPEIHVLAAQQLREAQQQSETLVRAARGELETLFRDVGMAGDIAILTDPQGTVLFSLGEGQFAGEAARVALRAGAGWEEAVAGTNAIGAALAEKQAISVIGGEHFFEMHRFLSCSAVPIFDPFGGVAGVLDLTSASNIPQIHTLALANRAVQQIERNLFEAKFGNHEQMRFHSDPYLIGSSQEGLLAFEGDRIAGANRSGIALAGLDWPARGAIRFDDLFTVEQGGVSQNPASDDCIVQTRKGKLLYARMRPQQRVHRGWSPAGTLASGAAGGGDAGEDPPLPEIINRLLGGPMARQLKVRRLKKGQLVYGADEEISTAQGFVIVRTGRLRCFTSFEGKELTLFMLDAGDALPLHATSMFEAKRDSEIVIMSGKVFRDLAQRDPDLARSATPAISRMLQKSEQMIEDMVFRGVKYRVIRALCEAAGRDGCESGEGIVLYKPPSAEEFAMQIGTTRQSVSTAIAGLIRDGIVRRLEGSALAIPDLDRLKRELNGSEQQD
jgi:sigma-54 dependent transcriptional regulator, acetoin dehydrogenase operon transcriptional activator AcoR